MRLLYIPIIACVFFGCSKETVDFNVVSTLFDGPVELNKEVLIQIESESEFIKVEYFIDGNQIGSSILYPFSITWTPEDLAPGIHDLTVIGYYESETLRLNFPFETKIQLGDSFRGGIIFHIENGGKNCLICLAEDLYNNGYVQPWGEPGVNISATDLDYGYENTMKMAAISKVGHAGYLFSDLTIQGYDDWYIPSKNELILLKENQNIVGGFSSNSSMAAYWSSTEINRDKAFALNFAILMGTDVPKDFEYRVRPIRKH